MHSVLDYNNMGTILRSLHKFTNNFVQDYNIKGTIFIMTMRLIEGIR